MTRNFNNAFKTHVLLEINLFFKGLEKSGIYELQSRGYANNVKKAQGKTLHLD
jgi:hypothetical protein